MKNQTILAIDTCTEVCSVSLATQGKIYSRFVQDVVKSSGLILPLCNEMLEKYGLSVPELDVILYTKGPGSFTGVRICVSIVQGISVSSNIPTVGFSTLEVVGAGAAKKFNTDKIAVALDARMKEVYWAVFQEGIMITERLTKPDEVDALGDDFIGIGTGWKTYEHELIKQTGINKFVSDFYPKSENLIDLYLSKKSAYDDKLPLPTYLRNNVAKKSLK